MGRKLTIALAGNPNSGKTTVFNRLTGMRQHVGNYPGVTVEKKQGRCRHDGVDIDVVDLPGTYSLTAYTIEELVARRFIVEEKPDVLVDIVDSANLERNLYLAVQFMELGVPLVLAFNMSDVAKAQGVEFDLGQLARLLGAPIVPTVGTKGQGLKELLDEVLRVAGGTEPVEPRPVRYGREIEEEIARLQELLEAEDAADGYPARWLAIKLLEDDRQVREAVGDERVLRQAERSAAHLERIFGDRPEVVIAGRRYGFISGACQEAVRLTVETRHTLSDRIDAVLTNQVIGLPIFLGLMYVVFHLTFTLGEYPMGWLEGLFGWLGRTITQFWPPGSESVVKSLLVDGVIGGVGGVVGFLPNILLLFMAIAFLEDSGYMARAAFLMDRLMHRIGLHGKSFIPMLIGFGCSIPAILATRTLEGRRDRLTTMLVLPLMSCGARLTIYALIIPAFFAERWRAPMLWLIYLIGIVLAIASAKLLRMTVLRGEAPPFVMELPLYRLPTLRGLLVHMWDRGWMYLRKAGTVILAISVILWALMSYPKKTAFDRDYDGEAAEARAAYLAAGDLLPDGEAACQAKLRELDHAKRAEELAYSVAGRIGHGLEPVLRPLGFDWRIGTALIGALAAKEVFVAQMGIVFAVGAADEGSDALRERLQAHYTPLQAFCIMLFCLISAPCVATIAVTRKESGSWKWAALQLGGLTVLAYVVTLLVYQVGRLMA